MFESGRYVAEALGGVDAEQVQPNGVDLRLGAVFEQVEPGRVGADGKTVGERRELDPDLEVDGATAEEDASGRDTETGANDAAVYRLDPGGYVVRYADTVRIPEGNVGFLYPRSSLLRNSCMLDTAVWDAGYEGRGEGLLRVGHEIRLDAGARIAQLVFATADHEERYDGTYQGENL